MTVYLFDMDGTLTPPRKPMTDHFSQAFKKWLLKNKAFIATGSDFSKVQEQLSQDIINAFTGIYCAMGNQYREGNKVIHQNDFNMPEELRKDLINFRNVTTYPGKLFDNFIEERVGMVNFSVLGRNCPYEERLAYQAWDKDAGERLAIQKYLLSRYKDLDIAVGGSISMDITPKGFGKDQIASAVRKAYPNDKIVFFGDKTMPGGNDYELAFALTKLDNTCTVQVDGPEYVLKELGLS